MHDSHKRKPSSFWIIWFSNRIKLIYSSEKENLNNVQPLHSYDTKEAILFQNFFSKCKRFLSEHPYIYYFAEMPHIVTDFFLYLYFYYS